MDSEFRKKQKENGVATKAALKKYFTESRFLIGTHNSKRLSRSLLSHDKYELTQTTLLNSDVHKAHSENLAVQFIRKWDAIKTSRLAEWSALLSDIKNAVPRPTDSTISSSSHRFLTLVDSVELLNAPSAVGSVKRMKRELAACIRKVRGVTCLGAVEVEVISIKMMRRIRELNSSTEIEQRKLEVCEVLAEPWLNGVYEGERSHMLIHFHGVITADRESNFEKLSAILRSQPQWSQAPRQIELKKLSEEFAGRKKTTENNLKDIAKYITKGGNDWNAGKAYLRYKISFNNEMNLNEEEWSAFNWRRNEELRQEHQEEGITDILSLTPHEISELATVIDGMMSLDKTRTGYLIRIGYG